MEQDAEQHCDGCGHATAAEEEAVCHPWRYCSLCWRILTEVMRPCRGEFMDDTTRHEARLHGLLRQLTFKILPDWEERSLLED